MKLDPKYRAIGLDMDGTLLDTKVDYAAMADRTYGEILGAGVPERVIDRGESYKLNMDAAVAHLESAGRGAEVPALLDRVAAITKRVELENVSLARPFPGAASALRRLRSRGYRVGVLTRGSREYADLALSTGMVAGLLDAVVARDDYPEAEAKPSPAAMRHLADKLGVEPAEILYVGDHKLDYMCARASGAGFAGVLSGAFDMGDWRALDPGIQTMETVADLGDIERY